MLSRFAWRVGCGLADLTNRALTRLAQRSWRAHELLVALGFDEARLR
jgi:hypothetical protein